MSRSIALGLLCLLAATHAHAAAARKPAPPPAAAIDVAPRTPLYCEGGGHSIQPLVYGDYGDLLGAYDRLHHWSGKLTANGPTKAGEEGFRLTFVAPPDDPRSPEEVVAFTLTRHEAGYALRAVSDKPKGLRAKRVAGNAMCFKVLEMLLDSDPQRALAFRKAWGEKHPDSTGR
jgi:hypothetical protein